MHLNVLLNNFNNNIRISNFIYILTSIYKSSSLNNNNVIHVRITVMFIRFLRKNNRNTQQYKLRKSLSTKEKGQMKEKNMCLCGTKKSISTV